MKNSFIHFYVFLFYFPIGSELKDSVNVVNVFLYYFIRCLLFHNVKMYCISKSEPVNVDGSKAITYCIPSYYYQCI